MYNIKKVKKSAKGEDERIALRIIIFPESESEKCAIPTIHICGTCNTLNYIYYKEWSTYVYV